MAIAYPLALDVLANPHGSASGGADNLNTPLVVHGVQHQDANDAVEAIESTVGITNSLDPLSLDYLIRHNSLADVRWIPDPVTSPRALIGGDFTGDARGDTAIDVQTRRNDAAEVASGLDAVAIGNRSKASGEGAIALGAAATATGASALAIGPDSIADGVSSFAVEGGHAAGVASVAFGSGSDASGDNSIAFGSDSVASAERSTALGKNAKARIARTLNFGGGVIVRKDDGESAATAFEAYAGVEVVLLSKEYDLLDDDDDVINIPAGAHFWLNEIGVICTLADTVTVQPEIQMGDENGGSTQLAPTLTTDLDATHNREFFLPLDRKGGHTQLTFEIVTGGSGNALNGRFYFKGMLIEDE